MGRREVMREGRDVSERRKIDTRRRDPIQNSKREKRRSEEE